MPVSVWTGKQKLFAKVRYVDGTIMVEGGIMIAVSLVVIHVVGVITTDVMRLVVPELMFVIEVVDVVR